MEAVLFILDAIIVGCLVSVICSAILGDTPMARLLRLLLSFGCGIAYLLLCITVNESSSISFGLATFIMFAPIGLAIVVWVLNYMFKDN